MCIRLEADDEKFNSRDIEMHFEILNLIQTHISNRMCRENV